MNVFDLTQLRRLDLTLLLVFEEAMASGKLSAVAKRLGLTQSAISHSLKRLREIFGDELFVRTPRGIVPTQRALALRAPLAEAVSLISGVVQTPRFDPAHDERVFRIAAPDSQTALFAPMLAKLGTTGARFLFLPLIRHEAILALGRAEIDLALGYHWDRSGGSVSVVLYEEDYVVVARRDHPILAEGMTIDSYLAYPHVLTAPGGTMTGIVDEALATTGRKRMVSVAVPYFLGALAIVAASDLLATVPRRIAVSQAEALRLVISEPPLALRPFPVNMTWSKRTTLDPALCWLRGRIETAASSLLTIC